MSRKDYVAIAAAINRAFNSDFYESETYSGIEVTATFIADALQAENPRFDRERFLAAALEDQ